MDIWPLPKITFQPLNAIQESRPVALLAPAGDSVSKSIKLPIVVQAEPPHNERDFAEMLAQNLPSQVQVVYAIAEDPAILNVAKRVASRNQRPLVIIPTAISSDAAFSASIVLKQDGTPSQVESGAAQQVVIDFDLIKSAPAELRGVGIVDVLSVIPALNDWTFANNKKKTTPETKFEEWAVKIASSIALQAIKAAPGIGTGETAALRELIDLMCLVVQLGNQLGHQRASHGTEHIFADAYTGAGSYAQKVGIGILLASALHNKDRAALRSAMQSAGLGFNQLDAPNIRTTFSTLPDFARAHSAPYTILTDMKNDATELTDALSKSTLFDGALA